MESDPEECRRRAENGLRMAETAKTSSLADQFEQLAERWLRVAEDNERVEEYLAILKATAKKSPAR